MRRAIISSAWCWPMTRCASVSPRLQHRLDLVLHHPADRDAGPVGDHRGHGLGVHRSAGSAACRPAARRACACCESCSSASEPARARLGGAAARCGLSSVDAARCRARSLRRAAPGSLSTSAFSSSQRACERRPAAPVRPRASRATSLRARADLDARRCASRSMMPLSISSDSMRRCAVFDLGRRGVLADRDAGAGGVEQADRLVGQLARGDVAVRERDRGFERLVEQLHPVMLLERRGDAAQHQRSPSASVGSSHLHDLEAAGQRRVLLDVLLVLGPGGGGDGAQRCRAPAPA